VAMNLQPEIVSGECPDCGDRISQRLSLALACSSVIHLLLLFFPVSGTKAESMDSRSSSNAQAPGRLSVALPTYNASRVWNELKLTPALALPNPPQPIPRLATPSAVKSGSGQIGKAELVPAPQVIYYPTSFLSIRPQPQTEAELDPPRVRSIVASGKVNLVIWINPHGQTVKIVVEAADLPSSFVTAATDAFVQLRFSPGELHGQRVGSVMRIEVTYDDGRLMKTEISE
jgi:hypothetical protein